jgi:hypothetical protein
MHCWLTVPSLACAQSHVSYKPSQDSRRAGFPQHQRGLTSHVFHLTSKHELDAFRKNLNECINSWHGVSAEFQSIVNLNHEWCALNIPMPHPITPALNHIHRTTSLLNQYITNLVKSCMACAQSHVLYKPSQDSKELASPNTKGVWLWASVNLLREGQRQLNITWNRCGGWSMINQWLMIDWSPNPHFRRTPENPPKCRCRSAHFRGQKSTGSFPICTF